MSSIFLAHSFRDKAFARRLADDLTRHGVRVWLDEREAKPGDAVHATLERAIERTKYVGVILSPDAVRSPWVKREIQAALTKESSTRRVVVIPILYRRCRVPLFLKSKIRVDFSSRRRHAESVRNLVSALRITATLERALPPQYRVAPPWDPEVRMSARAAGVLRSDVRDDVFTNTYLAFLRARSVELIAGNISWVTVLVLSIQDAILDAQRRGIDSTFTYRDIGRIGSATTLHVVDYLIGLACRLGLASVQGRNLELDGALLFEFSDSLLLVTRARISRPVAPRRLAHIAMLEAVRARLALHNHHQHFAWDVLLAMILTPERAATTALVRQARQISRGD